MANRRRIRVNPRHSEVPAGEFNREPIGEFVDEDWPPRRPPGDEPPDERYMAPSRRPSRTSVFNFCKGGKVISSKKY